MKRLLLAVTLVGLCLAFYSPARASAQEMCADHEPTIASLTMCVHHAASEGLIDNSGVATSLFATLDAAQAALNRGQTSVAVNLLQAFINEVQAQSGHHIDAMHAQHMIEHARMVIQALQP